jgi:hypothetical protein
MKHAIPKESTSAGWVIRRAIEAGQHEGLRTERSRICKKNREQWAFNRRVGHAARGFGAVGKGAHSHVWKEGCHLRATICGKGPSIVCMERAVRDAARADRESFQVGDGCASRCCQPHGRHPGQQRASQISQAIALIDGQKQLIEWPEGRRYQRYTAHHQAIAAIAGAMVLARELAREHAEPTRASVVE